MKDKLFIISIPMQPEGQLKKIRYLYSDGTYSRKTSFPGIALLEKHAIGKSPVKIVTVRTDDENFRTKECYEIFQKELEDLSKQIGMNLTVQKEIVISHKENNEKQKQFLRELFEFFERSSYVYMDLTFGTKISSIEMFSSLCYAEIVQKCNIKGVYYGKYSFDNSRYGELFDTTNLYHTVRFLETAAQMERNAFADLVKQILE